MGKGKREKEICCSETKTAEEETAETAADAESAENKQAAEAAQVEVTKEQSKAEQMKVEQPTAKSVVEIPKIEQPAVKAEPEAPVQPTTKWTKKRIAFAAGGALVIVAGTAYMCGVSYFKDKFHINTTINGIDVSFDTVAEVDDKIARSVGTYTMELQGRDGVTETISAEDIAYRYVSKGEVEKFKNQQSPYDWLAGLFGGKEYFFESSTEYDEAKLDEKAKSLKFFDESVLEKPENAYIDMKDGEFYIVPEEQGAYVRQRTFVETLHEEVQKSTTKLNLDEAGCYAEPSITSEDPKMKRVMRHMNKFCEAEITYTFGEKTQVLDKELISKWVQVDYQGEITLDETKVAEYVEYLGLKYDTYGKPRYFETHDGSFVDVKNSEYGWMIDREQETLMLMEDIKRSRKIEREPVYSRIAASRENEDLGDSYVEIDLTNQKVWLYIDGKEILETDCVSGLLTDPGRKTPDGIYGLAYKQSPSVLRGPQRPDGSFEWESPVTYWMPFNGGIGLHDANWRSVFGGNINSYNGSHGCINLPTDAAQTIYQNIESGFPIICYYR